MRAVIQRVTYGKVRVDDELIASIDRGIMVLVGFHSEDNEKSMTYIINKIINMRIFEDENSKMNLSLIDINGELLIVPNFTLYGDGRKGNRPSYSIASSPQQAAIQFSQFVSMAKQTPVQVKTGQFQSDMKVEILNDGPVTLLLDSNKEF